MKATELFHQDGKSAGVFYCGECRHVHRDQVTAEGCCAQPKCDCGEPCERHHIRCLKCETAEMARREAERFEKAEKVTEWDGPVWCNRIGYNDGYFPSIEELLDYIADDEETERPEYVWTCKVRPICHLDLWRILENATESNAPEDWEISVLTGQKELEAALEAFNKQNADNVYWQSDYKRVLLLPKVAIDPST